MVWTPDREALWRATGLRPAVAVWTPEHLARFLTAVRDDDLIRPAGYREAGPPARMTSERSICASDETPDSVIARVSSSRSISSTR